MKIKEIMNEQVVTVKEGDTLQYVSRIFYENSISGAPVIDGKGRVVGMISESDIVKAIEPYKAKLRMIFPSLSFMSVTFEKDMEERAITEVVKEVQRTKVTEVMAREVFFLEPDDLVEKAIITMNQRNVNRIPVISNGELVGIVARADILRCLVNLDLSRL